MPTLVLYLFWGALSIQKKNNGKNFCIPAAVYYFVWEPKLVFLPIMAGTHQNPIGGDISPRNGHNGCLQ
jgi:hypothetical protein